MSEEKKEVLRFSLELVEIPVELENPETGNVDEYVLREMNGTGRDKYLGYLGDKMDVNSQGDVKMKDYDGLQANLLSRCMFKIEDDGERSPVSIETIQSFPARVTTALFEKAKLISGMDDDAEETARND